MTSIFNKLNDIKGKLASLEENITTEIKKEEEINFYKQRIDKKIPFIIKQQKSKIKLNVGNEFTYVTSIESILSFNSQTYR